MPDYRGPMATPRKNLVDPIQPLHYHIVSRCVRRAWLCGTDPLTGRNYDYRRKWIEERLSHLAQYFSVSIESYAIMSNHFHLVVHYDPLACRAWSKHEVARRWLLAFPKKDKPGHNKNTELARQALLQNPALLEKRRQQLSSLSTFMQHLKQPISYKANQEDELSGHFFEQRFYSSALLDESAVLAAMAYVDLNPVRAKLTQTLAGCAFTSIQERLSRSKSNPMALQLPLEPLYSGLSSPAQISLPSLQAYTEHLNKVIDGQQVQAESGEPPNEHQVAWVSLVTLFRRRQRAYGSAKNVADWLQARAMRQLEQGFPA